MQAWAIIGNRQRVAFFGIGFQANRDPACTVFGGVCDQFVGDEAERNSSDGRQSDFDSLDDDDPPRVLGGQHHREVATKIVEVLLECKGLHAVQRVKTPVDASDRGNAIGCGAKPEATSPFVDARACSESKLAIICKPFSSR